MIFIDGIIFSLQKSGGISVLFNEIISRLPKENYKLIGFNAEPPSYVADGNYSFVSPRLMERYRRVLVNCEAGIFHSTYYRLPATKSCKVVTTVHDFTYEYFSNNFRRTVHAFQKNKAISESDKIICVSENTRQDLLEFLGNEYEERTFVVNNGVSSDYYYRPEIDTETQVIFVGARSGYKNFKSVVQALSGLQDLHLICVGGGAMTSAEIDLMDKHIPGRYRHAGYLTNDQLNCEYNRSLCLIYPSLYEGFGIPVLEAMRAGCPVIAVNKSSIPEVTGSAAILLDSGDADEIRQGISTITATSCRDDLVEKGRVQASKFSWDRTYKQTLEVYESL